MESARKEHEAPGQKRLHEDKSRGDNPEDCQVCMMAFDDTMQRPRTLPCGHTFCTPCVNRLEQLGEVICATCRRGHKVPEAGQFPINYTLEAFITKGSDSEAASASSSPRVGRRAGKSGQKAAAGLGRRLRSMLQEQEAKVLAAISACQEVQVQLDQYQTILAGWGNHQQQLEDRLQAVINDSKSARVLVRKEESQVTVKKEEVQQEEQQLHVVLETIRKVSTEQEVGLTVIDVVHCTDDAEETVEECRAMFPDVYTVTNARKVREASMAAAEAVKAVQAALQTTDVPARVLPARLTNTITDKLHVLLTPTLKAEDLRNMTLPARSLIEADMVVAVNQVEDRQRHARISLENGRLYLHALQDQPPPPCAARLQMDEVVPAALPCLVFLDLAWSGSAPQRVLIRLSPDTPMGRQFLLLCTGQEGPCYVNTRLWKVKNKGKPGECVCGGDYERNDGTGGAALLPDLEKGEYWRSGRAGAVWRWTHRGTLRGTLFGIVTRDRQDGRVMGGIFGEVVRGVDTVSAAAQHAVITDVTVVDCGVVL